MIYIDFDLQFSSLLQNLDSREFAQMSDSEKLSIVQPPDDILEFVTSMARYNLQQGGVMILDSLNSLQNLLTDDRATKGSKEAESEDRAHSHGSAKHFSILCRLTNHNQRDQGTLEIPELG